MTRIRSGAIGLLGALALASAPGCAANDSPAALVSLDGDATACSVADADGRIAFALSTVENVSEYAVTITDIQLIDADAVELIGVDVRLLDDPPGTFGGMPYENYGPASLDPDESIPPRDEPRLIVIGLQSETDRDGSAQGLRVTYRAEGQTTDQTVDTRIAYSTVPQGEICAGE